MVLSPNILQKGGVAAVMSNNYNHASCQSCQANPVQFYQTNRQAGYNNSYMNPACDKACDCSCDNDITPLSSFPENYSYAMAYIPFQQFDSVYPADKALCRGTLFPCLDKPWMVATRGCIR